MDAADAGREVEVDLSTDAFVSLLDALSSSGADAITRASSTASSASLEGPKWIFCTPEEADAMPTEKRRTLLAVRGSAQLLLAHDAWELTDMSVFLWTADRKRVATIEVAFDNRSIEFTCAAGVTTECVLDAAAAARLKTALTVAPPTIERCIETMQPAGQEARPFARNPDAFLLPTWVGECMARFLSASLRLHVVTGASMPAEASRPMRLENGGCLFRSNNASGSAPLKRISFTLHSSVCACVCGTHRCPSKRARTHRRVVVVLQFCGDRRVRDFGGCARHPHEKRSTRPLAARVCCAGARLHVRCMHGDGDADAAAKQGSAVSLPADSPFLKELAGACMDLVEPNGPDAATLERALCAALDEALADSADRAVELARRDRIVEELLLDGSFYYGPPPSRRNGAHELRQHPEERGQPAPAVCTTLKSCMSTHSHLLPRA